MGTTRRKPKRARELLTEDDYTALLAAQDGRCAICRRPPKEGGRRLSVDHDHATGAVRGLLCFRDNRMLPTYATTERLDAAWRYLVRHELRQSGRLRYIVDDSGCWIWSRALSDAGYPVLRYDRQLVYVHRLMCPSPIPAGHVVHHTCERRACVNPAHLTPMDRGDHTRHHEREARTCKRGHEWTEANTYRRPDNGLRQCRACIAMRSRGEHLDAAPTTVQDDVS